MNATTAAQAADRAAEAIRTLNHVTLRGGYTWPSDVDEVIGGLQVLAERLPQALQQAAGWLETAHAAGRVGHDRQSVETDSAVIEVLDQLDAAAQAAQILAAALRVARAGSSHLTGGAG